MRNKNDFQKYIKLFVKNTLLFVNTFKKREKKNWIFLIAENYYGLKWCTIMTTNTFPLPGNRTDTLARPAVLNEGDFLGLSSPRHLPILQEVSSYSCPSVGCLQD